ncbi:hypothetical protein CLIB1423_04S06722 [[Candida] railenensis]|uniref:DNA helicase n=1 Tax=[Candida] railenensis TaxID=45579 RepID=A0A9P0QN60_9ASCO|nr:hypothetical protein CLIB1423_04S06722 [[Candida] railenensis]
MADKEITTFVVDISSSMGVSSSPASRELSDLDLGLKYLFDVASAKAIRGRKTDFISVIAVHSPETENPYSSDDSFQNIEIVSKRIAPISYVDLKNIHSKLQPNPVPNSEYSENQLGDVFEGLVLAVSLLKDTSKLKFNRNIVLITNGESSITSFDSQLAGPTLSAMEKLSINLLVIGIDFENVDHFSDIKRKNVAKWRDICANCYNGKLITGNEALQSILYHPPLKKVRPMKAFKGQLRLGIDYQKLLKHSKRDTFKVDVKKEDIEESYEPDLDTFSLCLNVECYPATKIESLPSGHSFFVDKSKNASKISQIREYYIETAKEKDEAEKELGTRHSTSKVKSEEDPEVKVEAIQDFDKIKAFKYSNYDLIPLDPGLEEATTLKSIEGIDIVGFLKKTSFSYAYLTEESFYVIPESNSLMRSVVGFNSFCSAMIELECYAIVRYVQKENSEVRMCVLLPYTVEVDDGEFVYTCSMVRIPFKEDEKIGRFPFLTPKQKSNRDQEENGEAEESVITYPSEEVNKLMESFILSRDLDKEDSHTSNTNISIPKTVSSAKSASLLPVPPERPSDSTDSKLLSNSPAIHKFNINLRRMIIATLSNDDINDALNDPDFVQKYLVSKETNLFNLSNVLSLNSSSDKEWLSNLNLKSNPIAKELIKELDVRYITKEEADQRANKRRKGAGTNVHSLFSKNPQGTFGANEGDYDAMPDLDNLLNG